MKLSTHFCRNFLAASLLFTTIEFVNGIETCKPSYRKVANFRLIAQNTRLDASVIETTGAHTLLMCSMQCINDVRCKSSNYNAMAKRCEKLSGNRLTDGNSKLIAANSWEHYELVEVKVTALKQFGVQFME